MKTPYGMKIKAISNLQRCNELLFLRDDGHNEEDIAFLMRYIIETEETMEKLAAVDSLDYYRKRMNNRIIEALGRLGIEYIYY